MASLSEIERKRSSLSERKREILEKRLQGAAAGACVSDKLPDAGNDLKAEMAKFEPLCPMPLSWEDLRLACREQAAHPPEDLDVAEARKVAMQADRSALACACIALDAIGLFKRPGEAHTVDDIVANCGILPSYRKLMARWMGELSDAHLLNREQDQFVSVVPLVNQISAGEWPEFQGLADKATVEIPAILTGKKHTVELIFSMGSAKTVERAYEATASSRYFNSVVASAFRALVGTLPLGRPLRILEVGAGVGGTTSSVLPLLPPDRSFYAFTDLSQYFLGRAKLKYQSYPFISYGILDINVQPEEYGFIPRAFDVVLAANVLHCARFLGATLQHMCRLLTGSGLLILIEYTENRVAHIVLPGLLEGFSHFEDERLKTGKPLLSSAEWFRVLRANGFEKYACFPEQGGPLDVLGEHVIIGSPANVQEFRNR